MRQAGLFGLTGEPGAMQGSTFFIDAEKGRDSGGHCLTGTAAGADSFVHSSSLDSTGASSEYSHENALHPIHTRANQTDRVTASSPSVAVAKAHHNSLEKTAATSVTFCGCPSLSSETSSTMTTEKVVTPPKTGSRFYRFIRWNFFSVYRVLFTITFSANLVVALVLLLRYLVGGRVVTSEDAITAAAANFFASLVSRNEHFVNWLFTFCVGLPKTAPLCVRTNLAKIYNYGGIHSGCAVAAVGWYMLFSALITHQHVTRQIDELGVLAVCWIIIALLLAILIFAHPQLRAKLHNQFEWVHRFAGWTVIALFWIQVVFVAEWQSRITDRTVGRALLLSPTFWFLIGMSLCVIYPWARLRARTVRTEFLSEHAVRLHFDYTKPKGCSAVKITDSPLKETHAFAVIPAPKDQPGFSVIVSNAGDWTKRTIQRAPTKMYTRGTAQQGVIRVAAMFNPVVVVATGSGIGPCLGLFTEYPNLNCRVLWSTPSPEKTYGRGVIDAVKRADPNARIVDTRIAGRQDMVAASYELYREARAEAVVIISNGKLTWKVVYGLETRGVPAYGPIWDC